MLELSSKEFLGTINRLGILNLTPHTINFVIDGKLIVEIPPSGYLVRLKTKIEKIGDIKVSLNHSIPLKKVVLGDVTITDSDSNELSKEEIENLLENVKIVLVSMPVASNPDAVKKLKELSNNPELIVAAPNTNEAVRDEQGRIKGVKSIAVYF